MEERGRRDFSEDVDYLYQDRENFCIIGLTGYTTSGCSRLAEYMDDSVFFRNANNVRNPESIPDPGVDIFDNDDLFFNKKDQNARNAVALDIFKRKYSVCYDFISPNYKPFLVISM